MTRRRKTKLKPNTREKVKVEAKKNSDRMATDPEDPHNGTRKSESFWRRCLSYPSLVIDWFISSFLRLQLLSYQKVAGRSPLFLKGKTEDSEQEISKLTNKIKELTTEKQQLRDENNRLRESYTAETDANIELKESKKDLENSKRELSFAKGEQAEEIAYLKVKNEKQEKENKELRDKNSELKEKNEKQQKELDGEIKELRDKSSKLEKKNEELADENKELDEKNLKEERLNKNLQQTNEEQSQQIDSVNKQSNIQRVEIETLSKKIKSLENNACLLQDRVKAEICENSELRDRIQGLTEEKSVLEEEKLDALRRLSEQVSVKLRDNNPNIVDLSDQCRPTKLAEMFSELYDNEWTNAFSVLEDTLTEEQAIVVLLDTVMIAYGLCETKVNEPWQVLTDWFIDESLPGVQQTTKWLKDSRKTNIQKKVSETEKNFSEAILRMCTEESLKTLLSDTEINLYFTKCIELCLLMVATDPPVVLVCPGWDVTQWTADDKEPEDVQEKTHTNQMLEGHNKTASHTGTEYGDDHNKTASHTNWEQGESHNKTESHNNTEGGGNQSENPSLTNMQEDEDKNETASRNDTQQDQDNKATASRNDMQQNKDQTETSSRNDTQQDEDHNETESRNDMQEYEDNNKTTSLNGTQKDEETNETASRNNAEQDEDHNETESRNDTQEDEDNNETASLNDMKQDEDHIEIESRSDMQDDEDNNETASLNVMETNKEYNETASRKHTEQDEDNNESANRNDTQDDENSNKTASRNDTQQDEEQNETRSRNDMQQGEDNNETASRNGMQQGEDHNETASRHETQEDEDNNGTTSRNDTKQDEDQNETTSRNDMQEDEDNNDTASRNNTEQDKDHNETARNINTKQGDDDFRKEEDQQGKELIYANTEENQKQHHVKDLEVNDERDIASHYTTKEDVSDSLSQPLHYEPQLQQMAEKQDSCSGIMTDDVIQNDGTGSVTKPEEPQDGLINGNQGSSRGSEEQGSGDNLHVGEKVHPDLENDAVHTDANKDNGRPGESPSHDLNQQQNGNAIVSAEKMKDETQINAEGGHLFDKELFKEYTKRGKYLDYIVWPAMCLHKDGPLLSKGVAQGRKGQYAVKNRTGWTWRGQK